MVLRKQLEAFGDIAWTKDHRDSLQVTFYDARCTARVKAMCGDTCAYGPQDGDRYVTLSKQGLACVELTEVSNVELCQDGTFRVEFFDVRTAAKVLFDACEGEGEGTDDSTSACSGDSKEEAWGHEGSSPTKLKLAAEETKPAAPRKVINMQLAQVDWKDLGSKREWRTVLRLRGLPPKLCEPGMLEAYLEKQNLRQHVDKVRAQISGSSKKTGCAVIRCVSVAGVKELAKFFHGRQFGGSLVAVSFAADQPKPTTADAKQGRATVKRPETADLLEPVRISPSQDLPRMPRRASEPMLVSGAMLDLPPGLEPPPGLAHLAPRHA